MNGTHPLNHPIGPRPDLLRSLASRAAVTKEEPARTLGQDIGGAAALILPVIPFGQVGIGFGQTAEPGQLGCPSRALRRAGERFGEPRCAQPLPEGARLLLAPLGQRQIGAAGMLAGEAPSGFAVPGEIDGGQRFTHDLLLRRYPSESAAARI